MIGYKFLNESDAQNARLSCDNHFGYPKEDCVTQHWVDYQKSELDGFWYITFDESIEPVLGAAEEFEITLPEANQ